jgi:hypothetical protein
MNSLFDMVTGELLDEPRQERVEAACNGAYDLLLGLQPVMELPKTRRKVLFPPELANQSIAAFIASQQ